MNSTDTTDKRYTTGKHLLILALVFLAGIAVPLSADNGKIPADLQTKLFLTALTYDKNLERQEETDIHIALLSFPWQEESRKEAEDFAKALENYQDKKISGRSFTIFSLTYNGNFGLKEKIADKHLDVLFITGGEESMVREIVEVTRSKKIISCTSRAAYVTACGVTMAVGLKGNKPKIYLNLSSAKREGADFGAKFLRVVEIVGEKR